MSVRELLTTLAGIQETVLLYPTTAGRPRARRMLTDTSPIQQHLFDLFDLARHAPTDNQRLGNTTNTPTNRN